MPRVSVVINCFNGERYLREAIDSVFAQTFNDWEIIFWDNASTDNSVSIAKSYHDARFRYFRGDCTVPLGEARRLAMDEARGEWVGFLDVDDFWLPCKLERQMIEVNKKNYVLCYGGVREIDGEGRIIRDVLPAYPSGEMFAAQLKHFDINMVTPLLHREALIGRGLTFDGHVTASEEYNLFMRLLAGGQACAIHEVLGCLRISPGTLTSRSISKWAEERFYTLQQIEAENPGITSRFPLAFAQAKARGYYYRARWHMAQGEPLLARNCLRQSASTGFSYRALGWLTYFPPMWRLAHAERLKRQLSSFFRIGQ